MKNGFPIINKKTAPFYPIDNKCPICSAKIGEPNTFVVLNGGALKQIEKNLLGMDDDLFGFLDICFHGAHDKGKGKHRDKNITVEIARDSKQGQFEIYFCSLICLRKFLNNIIDEMEIKLEK